MWWSWPRGPCSGGTWEPGSPIDRVGSGGFAASDDSPCGVWRYSDHAARGLGVALVSYVDTTITGRAFALPGRYRLDPNQELIALGLANVGTGFFQGLASDHHTAPPLMICTAAAASLPGSWRRFFWRCFYSTSPVFSNMCRR